MADGPKPNPGDEALRERLRQMILGFQVSQCLHVAAKLGIADLLKTGPMSGRELAVATRTEPAALVLLSYKLRRPRCTAAPPQQGQRGKRVTIAAMSLRRMVAIEFGMCRSGRKGGSSGSVTVGYGKLREQSGGTRS